MKECYRIERKITNRENGQILREFLKKDIKISRRALSAIKYKGGRLLVDGEEKTVRHVLKTNELLTIVFPPEQPSSFLIGEAYPLDIVYEDSVLLVVNKPAGVPVIPSHQYPSGTMANFILAYFEKKQLASTVHIVNRLDRNTSGLMLVAKNRLSHERFYKMQKEHEIHRRYLAFVAGLPDCRKGTIDAPIGRKTGSVIERRVDWQDGRRSITHFEVLKNFCDYALVLVRLQTGRTHQIRVHFASTGHPLLGDELYGGSTTKIKRQALHSFELSFIHPFTNQPIHLHAACPQDMKKLTGPAFSLDLEAL